MILPTKGDFVSIYKKLAQARWIEKSIIAAGSVDAVYEPHGQRRLLQLDSILRELGPLTLGERLALESIALDFAKKHGPSAGA